MSEVSHQKKLLSQVLGVTPHMEMECIYCTENIGKKVTFTLSPWLMHLVMDSRGVSTDAVSHRANIALSFQFVS